MIAKTHTGNTLFIIILLLSGCAAAALTPSSKAQQSNWLLPTSIIDTSGNTRLGQDQPMLSGHTYNMTFTVEVPFTQNTTTFSVILRDNMTRNGPQYWYLKTMNYTGYRPQLFTPGERSISFIQKEGSFVLSVIFMVPQNATTAKFNNITLRYLKQSSEIVYAKINSGAVVGTITHEVSDSIIEDYLTTASQKADLVAAGKIDKSFQSVVNGVINQADSIYRLGLPDKAKDILSTIDPALFPPPPDTTLQTALMASVSILVVVLVGVLIMYSRLNTRAQLSDSSLDATRDELASLEVTAGRYDDALAKQLRRLREKISEEEQ